MENLTSLKRGFTIDVHTGHGRSGQKSLFLRSDPVRNDVLADRPGVELISDAANSGVGYDIRDGYVDCFDVLPHDAEMHVHQVSA